MNFVYDKRTKLLNIRLNKTIRLEEKNIIIRRHGESIYVWFCWCTWRWNQFVFYIRYL